MGRYQPRRKLSLIELPDRANFRTTAIRRIQLTVDFKKTQAVADILPPSYFVLPGV